MNTLNSMVSPEIGSTSLLNHVSKELDALETKSCSRCNYIEDCNHLCGDVRIIDNIRQEIKALAKN